MGPACSDQGQSLRVSRDKVVPSACPAPAPGLPKLRLHTHLQHPQRDDLNLGCAWAGFLECSGKRREARHHLISRPDEGGDAYGLPLGLLQVSPTHPSMLLGRGPGSASSLLTVARRQLVPSQGLAGPRGGPGQIRESSPLHPEPREVFRGDRELEQKGPPLTLSPVACFRGSTPWEAARHFSYNPGSAAK